MDPPSSSVSREALQRRAYHLAEAAGFPPDQTEHFWLMAEQQLTPAGPASASAAVPARKVPAAAKRKPPGTPSAAAAEAAPVHPTRKKTVTKSAAKSPGKPAAPPPAKPATPAAKSPAKPRKPKAGDAS